jgi:hypothetical protein
VKTENNNAHLALHGMIAGLVFCAVVAGFFHARSSLVDAAI